MTYRAMLAAVLVALVSGWGTPVGAQTNSFTTFILNAPAATLPLGVDEPAPVVQDGITKKFFPGGSGAAVYPPRRTISSGNSDTVLSSDYAVYWDSPTLGAKSEAIPGCDSFSDKRVLVISDEVQTAGTYSITIQPASGTVANQTSVVLAANGASVILGCDSSTTNWVAQAGGVDTYTSPAAVSGLLMAHRMDTGVTYGLSNTITRVAGAYGTSIGLTAGAAMPTRAAGLSPTGRDMALFSGDTAAQYFTFPRQVLGAYTYIASLSPTSLVGANALWSFSGTPNTIVSIPNNGMRIDVRPTAPGGTTYSLPDFDASVVKSMQVVVLTFDGTLAGGTAKASLDCGATFETQAGVGTSFTFDKFGAGFSNNQNPLRGYLYENLLYNRVLTSTEITAVCAGVRSRAYPSTLYAANNGSATSTTPWLQTTPFTAEALVTNLRPGQTGLMKRGIYHVNGRLQPAATGTSVDNPIIIDGDAWGTGVKAQLRFATTPIPSLVSGTVYDLGPWVSQSGFDPTPDFVWVYYVPGGEVIFSGGITGYSTSNVVRLSKNTMTPTTPGVGQWGYDAGTNHVFANTGTALTQGDIELPVYPRGIASAGLLIDSTSNWSVRNIRIMFPARSYCMNLRGASATFINADGLYCEVDGYDTQAIAPGDGTSMTMTGGVMGYNGNGPATVGNNGDGTSCHDDTSCSYSGTYAVNNDKAGFDHAQGTTTTHNAVIAEGPMAIRYAAPGDTSLEVCGSYLLTNSIVVLPATIDPAQNPMAILENAYSTHAGTTACTLTAQANTFYSSSAAAGRGLMDYSSAGAAHATTMLFQDNIVNGFATALKLGTGVVAADLTGNHNLYFGNTSNYGAGISAGAGDVLANPLFVGAGDNFALQASSPAKSAGISITGIVSDFAGAPRANPPSIGAYE